MARVRSVAGRAARARARELPPRVRVTVFVFAAVAVAVALVWSWRHRPDSASIDFVAIGAAGLVTLVLIAVRVVEFLVAARLVGQRRRFGRSVGVVAAASAANLLPLPGAVVVSSHALSTGGATVGAATAAVTAVGVAWLSVSSAACGAVLVGEVDVMIGLALVALGLALVPAVGLLIRSAGARRGSIVPVYAVEVVFLAVSMLLYRTTLAAFGIDATWSQAIALSFSASAAVAVSFVPGGLGVQEVTTAAIGAAVDLPVAGAVLMTSANRIMWLLGLGLAFTVAAVWRRVSDGEPAAASG